MRILIVDDRSLGIRCIAGADMRRRNRPTRLKAPPLQTRRVDLVQKAEHALRRILD